MAQSQTADERTAAENTAVAAEQFGDDPRSETFASVLGAVHNEWRDAGYNDITGARDESVLTPVGQAIKSAAAALGYDATSMIDFDGNDEVTVTYTRDDTETPFAVPTDIVRVVAYADDLEPNRRIWIEEGAGDVQIYVDRTPVDQQ